MSKSINRQTGFGALEALLVVLVLVLVGILGYTFWNSQQKTETKIDNTPTPVDSYAGWKTYSSNDISFRYPSSWKVTSSAIRQDNQDCGTSTTVSPDSIDTKGFEKKPATYTVSFLKFSVQPSNCVAVGSLAKDSSGMPFNYLKSSAKITGGMFNGSYLTFLSSVNTYSNPDQAVLTSDNYDGNNTSISDGGFVKEDETYYRVLVMANDKDGYSALFHVDDFKSTKLYKDTLLIIQSVK